MAPGLRVCQDGRTASVLANLSCVRDPADFSSAKDLSGRKFWNHPLQHGNVRKSSCTNGQSDPTHQSVKPAAILDGYRSLQRTVSTYPSGQALSSAFADEACPLAHTARALEGRHCPAKSFWCLDEATSSASRAADINHGGASLGEEAQLNARLTPLHV